MTYYQKQIFKARGKSIELSLPQLLVLNAEFKGKYDSLLIPLGSQKYSEFIKWYTKKEQVSKTWIDSVLSGKDWYREQYLHPQLEEKILSIEENVTILDIGCGPGNVVIPNLKESHTYFGTDISRYALETAAKLHNLEIIGDKSGSLSAPYLNKNQNKYLGFESFRFGSWTKCEKFDEIILSQVIHNLPNYKVGLKSLMKTWLCPELTFS